MKYRHVVQDSLELKLIVLRQENKSFFVQIMTKRRNYFFDKSIKLRKKVEKKKIIFVFQFNNSVLISGLLI